MSLFNIRTKVEIVYDGGNAVVRITAAKDVRSKIWDLATNNCLNPGVARYDGGAPTIITLAPYPGYDGKLVANMAYTMACIAGVDDWTALFCSPAARLDDGVIVEGFVPNPQVVAELQRLYVEWKSVRTLESRIFDLSHSGLNTETIYAWHAEAIECYRRAGNLAQGKIDPMVDKIAAYVKFARAIDQRKAENRRALEYMIAAFEASLESSNAATAYREYIEVLAAIDAEEARLQTDVDGFRKAWDEIKHELMPAIRKATPPAPAKK